MKYVRVDWEEFDHVPLGEFNKEQPCRVIRRLKDEFQIIVSNVLYECDTNVESLYWWVPVRYCKDVPLYKLLLRV